MHRLPLASLSMRGAGKGMSSVARIHMLPRGAKHAWAIESAPLGGIGHEIQLDYKPLFQMRLRGQNRTQIAVEDEDGPKRIKGSLLEHHEAQLLQSRKLHYLPFHSREIGRPKLVT